MTAPVAASARLFRMIDRVEREHVAARLSTEPPAGADLRPHPARIGLAYTAGAAGPDPEPAAPAFCNSPIVREVSPHVMINAPEYQPLDPRKLAAIEWARRQRDGWDAVGVGVAVAGAVMMLARCLPVILPSWFN